MEKIEATTIPSKPELVFREMTVEERSEAARQMGHAGGTKTKEKYGHAHYFAIGKKGAGIVKERTKFAKRCIAFFQKHPELLEQMDKEIQDVD